MKKYIYSLAIAILVFTLSSCEKFLTLDPQGSISTENNFDSETDATITVNGIYDLIGNAEGNHPDGYLISSHYDFYFGSMISDDSEKGSKPTDGADVIDLVTWKYDGSVSSLNAFWMHGFWGVSRANSAIYGLNTATFDESLRLRLLGESYFLRAYYYLYLLKHYGGVPLFSEPQKTGGAVRASIHETIEFILADLDYAIDNLPKRSEYSSTDLGRATKGAAQALKARVLLYQAGIDGEVSDTKSIWQEAYNLTNDVITSGEYTLVKNFGEMFEVENHNTTESIFEVQAYDNGVLSGNPSATGYGYCNYQGNRISNVGASSGWGFNNPTQDLVNAFDPTDPRLSSTIYGIDYNNGVLFGYVQEYDRAQMGTNYLNRKAVLMEKPTNARSAAFDIILIRLADVILMRAEAAYMLGNEDQARTDVNTIRERARNSSMCKGYNEGDPTGYPAPTWNVNLPNITSTGNNLLEDIYKERRLELAMENLRTWDLIRQGKFLETIDKVKDTDRAGNGVNEETQYSGCKAACMEHCLGESHGAKVPVPVLAIPTTEVTGYGLVQNPY